LPLAWKARELVPVNKFEVGFDVGALQGYVVSAVNSIVASKLQLQTRCLFGPTLSFMKTVACSCGVNVGPECAVAPKTTKVDLGTTAVACGAPSRIVAGGVSVRLGSSSVSDCSRPAEIALEKAVAKVQSSTTTGTTVSKRSVVRLGKRTTTPSACYAMVVNSNTAFIGQLRGDCLTFNPNMAMSGVEICLPLKDSIAYDSTTYPLAGIATTSTAGDGSTVYTASATLTATDMTSAFCVTVNDAGTYCPGTFFV
jgi:hypothetical protein